MKNVEDVYPLSPMQEAMLFHACTRHGHDVLFNQLCYQLDGPLQQAPFRAAWQAVLDRHTALRSAFLWEGLKKPHQAVRRRLDLPFTDLDWQDLPEQEQQRRFEHLRAEDRARRFSLEKAPLMRVTLVQVATQTHWLIWSSHHLILDRWCIAVLLRDLGQFYQQAIEGPAVAPPAARPYRSYIKWIQQQDHQQAREFWATELQGLAAATPVTRALPSGESATEAIASSRIELRGEELQGLKAFCRANRLTLSTLVQGAWALVLNQCAQSQDVVFGVVASGRPAEIPDVEDIVGSFVNNVPVRVRLPADLPIIDWLRELQQISLRRMPYEYLSVAELEGCCELPGDANLFDSIVVSLAAVGAAVFPGIEFRGLTADTGTAYPLTVSVEESETSIAITLALNSQATAPAGLEALQSRLHAKLRELPASSQNRTLGDLPHFHGALTHCALRPGAEADMHSPDICAINDRSGSDVVVAGREEASLDAIEELVSYEWRQLLRLESIEPDTNFFELGGDSLKAARLLSRIEQGVRKKIPLLALFQTPTISGMTRVIRNEAWPLEPGIVTALRTRGAHPPLFCIASPDVNTLGYSVLSRHLDRERPAYVLQAPLAPGASPGVNRLQLVPLAGQYVDAILAVRDQGPYHLLGMCDGGPLGIEIARQLEARGLEVAFFGVIHSWALFTLSKFYYLQRIANRWRYYKNRLRDLATSDWSSRYAMVRGVLASRLQARHSPAAASGIAVPAAAMSPESSSPPQARVSMIDTIGWASDTPDTVPYSGTVTLFRVRFDKQDFWRVSDPAMGWGKHSNGVRIIRLPLKDRLDILREPQVSLVARELENCLQPEARTSDV